jgi:hypothetical protein
MSDKIAQTSSSSATTQDKRPIKGADGQLASITLKFKPFIFALGDSEDPGKHLYGVAQHGIKNWSNAAHKMVAPRDLHQSSR